MVWEPVLIAPGQVFPLPEANIDIGIVPNFRLQGWKWMARLEPEQNGLTKPYLKGFRRCATE
jgi:hypothetical protein